METEVKTNKNGKKISTIVIIVSVIVIVLVLGFWGLLRLQAKQAEKKVTAILSDLKDGNTQVLNEYLNPEDFGENLMDLGVEMEEEEANENTAGNKKFFGNLDYKVKKSQANFKNAKIEIEITNKDMGQVMSNYFKKSIQLLFQSAISDKDDSDEELTKKMVKFLEDELNSDDIEKVTKNVTIELSKENGEWIVKTEGKTIVDAILPGFIEVMNNFDDPLLDQKLDEELNQDADDSTEQGTPDVL